MTAAPRSLAATVLVVVAAAGALLALLLVAGRADARKATREERAAMIAATYRATGIDDPPECRNTWVTRVSRYRPRTGIVYGNIDLRSARGCVLGNGYLILRRPSLRGQAWRVVFQGSDPPPCRLITARMARELGLGRVCTPA
ncbi:MAG TPA: hypothetical protein VL422_13670 [Miltoncostaea sp.]|nr:hypothetical protein [Miltoncostaea sp.]